MGRFVTISEEEYFALWAMLLADMEHISSISEKIAELGWRIVKVEARDKAIEALETRLLNEIETPDNDGRLQ